MMHAYISRSTTILIAFFLFVVPTHFSIAQEEGHSVRDLGMDGNLPYGKWKVVSEVTDENVIPISGETVYLSENFFGMSSTQGDAKEVVNQLFNVRWREAN